MAKYVIDDTTLTNIANTIRGDILEEADKFTPVQMPEKIEQVIQIHRDSAYQMGASENYAPAFADGQEQGKKDAYDAFWDSFQDYGNRDDTRYFCAYYNFTPETFKPKYPIMLCSYSFYYCQMNISLIEQGVEFARPKNASTSLGYCFRGTKLTEVPTIDVSKGNNMGNSFYGSTLMRKIEKIISSEKTDYSSAFTSCNALEEIRFEGLIGTSVSFSDSPLTKESIISVIMHLSDASESQILTLNSSAVSSIDWTNTVIEDTAYNTFEDICNLKQNWTISLV